MKKTSHVKDFCNERLSELITTAEEQLAKTNLKLPLGTHTASSLKKFLKNSGYENLCDNYELIRRCERLLKRTDEKVHKWIIRDNREEAEIVNITFPERKRMKMLSRIARSNGKFNRGVTTFSLEDGCLRAIVTNPASYNCGSIFSFRIDDDEYLPPRQCSHLSFKIEAKNLEHLHGECKLIIYKDRDGDPDSFINPFHVRIAIENSEGWYVTSNEVIPLTKEFLTLYDSQFSNDYDSDSLPCQQPDVSVSCEDAISAETSENTCDIMATSPCEAAETSPVASEASALNSEYPYRIEEANRVRGASYPTFSSPADTSSLSHCKTYVPFMVIKKYLPTQSPSLKIPLAKYTEYGVAYQQKFLFYNCNASEI